MRVVSLNCSNTEIVHFLGCSHLLVGVDNHSDYPEDVVASLPTVGPDLDIDIEKVASLKPDIVLASLTVPGHEKVIEGLERAKLPFYAPETISIADIYEDIRIIGDLLGVTEKAKECNETIQKEIEELREKEPERRPSVLVQWWPKPVIAPGRKSWVNEMIEIAGGVNPLGNEDIKSRPMENDEVCELAPDAVVLSWCGVPFSKYRTEVVSRVEEWQSLPFVQQGHIYKIPEAYMGRPSPRIIEGIKELQKICLNLG